jgi:hypothetical protein
MPPRSPPRKVNGKAVVEKVRTERPHDYLKVCASVMPKRLENEDVTSRRDVKDMSDEELLAVMMTSSEWPNMSAEKKLEHISFVTDRLQRHLPRPK